MRKVSFIFIIMKEKKLKKRGKFKNKRKVTTILDRTKRK